MSVTHHVPDSSPVTADMTSSQIVHCSAVAKHKHSGHAPGVAIGG
jgi:hypothetical protein